MIPKVLYVLALAGLLAGSVWSGTSRVMGFLARYRGEQTLALGQLDDAYADLSEAARWQGRDAETWILLGRVIHLAQSNGVHLAALKEKDAAQVAAASIAATTRGLALNPSDAPAWFNVAQAYDAYHSARTRLDRLRAMVEAVQAGEDPTRVRKEMDRGALSSEDLMVVASTLKASSLEPEYSFYHDYLAKLYRDRGLMEDAGREIRQAFALTPQLHAHPWIYDETFTSDLAGPILEGIDQARSNRFVDQLAVELARAEILEMLGRTEEAIGVYRSLRLRGDPDVERECLLRLAKLHQGAGNYDKSIAMLERMVAAEPEGRRAARGFYYLGIAHARLGNHELAVDYMRRHLQRIVGTPNVLLAFAAELEATGQTTEAERIYLGLIERDEEDPRPFVKLIDLLLRKRRHVDALRYAQRFSDEMPGNPEASTLLGTVRGLAK